MTVTNNDLAVMIGELRSNVAGLQASVTEIKTALNGNGKPGLISDFKSLKVDVDAHLGDAKKQSEQNKEKKEKWSGRTWALVMVVFTQLVTLLIVFLRTGSIK